VIDWQAFAKPSRQRNANFLGSLTLKLHIVTLLQIACTIYQSTDCNTPEDLNVQY